MSPFFTSIYRKNIKTILISDMYMTKLKSTQYLTNNNCYNLKKM